MASTVSTSTSLLCMQDVATPIQFIDGNKLKSCKAGLTNHTWPISHHITALVINAFGGEHTDGQTDRHTCTHMTMH